MQWQKNFPLLPAKRVHTLFFPKMNTTVKIHRAQRIHICSTRYTLYKLDMYNSTECLNPCGSPTTKRGSNGQDCESERRRRAAVFVQDGRPRPVHFSSYRHSKDENQSKGRIRLSCPFRF